MTQPSELDDGALYEYLVGMDEEQRTAYIAGLSEDDQQRVNGLLMYQYSVTEDYPSEAYPTDYATDYSAGDGGEGVEEQAEDSYPGYENREQPAAEDYSGWAAGEDEQSGDEEEQYEGTAELAEDGNADAEWRAPSSDQNVIPDDEQLLGQEIDDILAEGDGGLNSEDEQDEDAGEGSSGQGGWQSVTRPSAGHGGEPMFSTHRGGSAGGEDEQDEDELSEGDDEPDIRAEDEQTEDELSEGDDEPDIRAETEQDEDEQTDADSDLDIRAEDEQDEDQAENAASPPEIDYRALERQNKVAIGGIVARDAGNRQVPFLQLPGGEFLFGNGHDADLVATAGASGTVRFSRNRMSANDFVVENVSGDIDYDGMQDALRMLCVDTSIYDYGDGNRVRVK